MKKKKGVVFVLSEKGNALTQEGANMFLASLGMENRSHIFYGSDFNRPDFLAGALTQAKDAYVAIYQNKQVYAIGPGDIRQFIAVLTLEKNRTRSSYEIFVNEIVPNMR